ncbi:Intracellular septation protein IspA [hydrothermal vent metagenome]|uniref:Intracellular septation protein IspA n=1 Tax=hydrothermal vent metagenome TaxID=652676 RepID=A0A3B0ZU47_9ZZZZ
MKLLFDFFPIVLFFIVFKTNPDETQGMINATAVLILATIVQVAANWIKNRTINKMHVITLVLVLIFGGATIYFQDKMFLIWKVTILYWLFAVVFIASQYIGKSSIIKKTMSHAISLPDNIWLQLNFAWAGFFVFVGVVNLYIAYNYDFGIWVNFKLFGVFGLMFAFIIIQALYISKYVKEDQVDAGSENKSE